MPKKDQPTLCRWVASSKSTTVPRYQASSSGQYTRSSRPRYAAAPMVSVSTLHQYASESMHIMHTQQLCCNG